MSSSLKTGVIGVGYLGRFHAQKFKQVSDLVGVFDVDRKRCEEVAGELGVRPFSSIEDLLQEVQAVSVVTSTRSHSEIGKTVLDAGVHLLMEKPITDQVDGAKVLIDLAKKSSLKLQVGHIERFNPAFQAAREVEPKHLEIIRSTPFNPRGADVDVCLDLMIHDIDLCCQWYGEIPNQVMARGQSLQSDTYDVMFAQLGFASGRTASLTASRVSQSPQRFLCGYSKDSFFECDLGSPRFEVCRKGGEVQKQSFERPDALLLEVQEFVACILEGRPAPVTGEEALRNLSVAFEVIRAANEAS